jgi:hypothetical protein
MHKPHQVINRSQKTTLVNHDMQQYNYFRILHLFYGILNFKFAFKGNNSSWSLNQGLGMILHTLILFLILSHEMLLYD